MPKIQKTKVLQGGLKETNLVQRPQPLVLMKKVPFTLGELKLLDTYLSRLNLHDPDSRTVTFTRAEYEELLGRGKINAEELRESTKSMVQKVVTLPKANGFKGYTHIALFAMAEYEENDYGEGEVRLECSTYGKKLIFNAENTGYLQYILKYSLNLKSKHSFLLYNYLLCNRFRGTWNVPLDELRLSVFRLNLIENPTYDKYKYFKRDVLDKALSEVNKHTDIEFKYSPKKRGKYVVNIEFELVKENDQYVDKLTVDDCIDILPVDDDKHENLDFLAGACDGEFSLEEIDELLQIIVCKCLPKHEYGIWTARFHYLTQKYAVLKHYASIKKIPNRFRYLKKIIENE
jgi:plasmid replication initiation protein